MFNNVLKKKKQRTNQNIKKKTKKKKNAIDIIVDGWESFIFHVNDLSLLYYTHCGQKTIEQRKEEKTNTKERRRRMKLLFPYNCACARSDYQNFSSLKRKQKKKNVFFVLINKKKIVIAPCKFCIVYIHFPTMSNRACPEACVRNDQEMDQLAYWEWQTYRVIRFDTLLTRYRSAGPKPLRYVCNRIYVLVQTSLNTCGVHTCVNFSRNTVSGTAANAIEFTRNAR